MLSEWNSGNDRLLCKNHPFGLFLHVYVHVFSPNLWTFVREPWPLKAPQRRVVNQISPTNSLASCSYIAMASNLLAMASTE